MMYQPQKYLGLFSFILIMAWPILALSQEVPGNPQNGKVLFEKHCANCHGVKGAGDGPDTQFLLVQPANFHSLESRSKTDWELMNVITYGAVFSPMHGWSERLTEDERWDVLRYIRFLAPFNPIANLLPLPETHG
ncbi:cytochrome c [uncultured Nitrospira sp.]|uniref:c-type cytochrome n=1 Tax=uncultured Nitrospira sp. TaxID=157176 RepID=UPI0031402B11